jgi:hypothetical protein
MRAPFRPPLSPPPGWISFSEPPFPPFPKPFGWRGPWPGRACLPSSRFPLRAEGAFLDGTPLAEAIRGLDAAAEPPALGSMGHSVHPSVFETAMGSAFPAGVRGGRRVGLQANASVRLIDSGGGRRVH